MQRQVNWPVCPVACTIARSVAALTLSWNDFKPLPGDRGLERIVDDAALNGTFTCVGHADEGVAPGAGRASRVDIRGVGELRRKLSCVVSMRLVLRSMRNSARTFSVI